MNNVIPAHSIPLPIYPDRPVTLPVTSVSDGANAFGDDDKQQPSTYVYRGELVEAAANDKRYRPQHNLQINPHNQRALEIYQKVASEAPVVGRILDGYI